MVEDECAVTKFFSHDGLAGAIQFSSTEKGTAENVLKKLPNPRRIYSFCTSTTINDCNDMRFFGPQAEQRCSVITKPP